ncbi:cell division cycle-associated protein 7 isoform X1 [Nothobranchius furzeri]|uniref:Cell division cycle-associated protein 7-like n=1 Tax=Nothobranchius furzeri TaxID=105023 RepID=A0A8C6MFX0_NOTFU|nr:cell division cycle-associated protein 7 isoform X1 [Nothobranchius furzeri]KAF7208077.1 cell division cycle-associated protein 7-like [Nothobranchius furzeri]
MNSDMRKLADLFTEDSENDATFYGFSDSEFVDTRLDYDDEVQLDMSPKEQQKTTSAGLPPFRLRVALRCVPSIQLSTGHDAEDSEKITTRRGVKRLRNTSKTKKDRAVKREEEESTVGHPSLSEERGSDSDEDVFDNFLLKREQNIKANKAMLAQLMADLQKIPEGAGIFKRSGKRKAKVRHSRPPHTDLTGEESRRYPERASRRQTRSMRKGQDPSSSEEVDVELSLEEELLEVRRAPRHRSTPRPNQSKPHVIRPVEDIKDDELQLVADNMTDKVYNSATGSTCHQCRQKTIDTKTCCRSEDCRGIRGQFCGPCLRNRYGEDVRKALLDPNWTCPPCRGICNCSFCRQREGRYPTGILFPLAQYHGFSDVHSYLTSLRNKLEGES